MTTTRRTMFAAAAAGVAAGRGLAHADTPPQPQFARPPVTVPVIGAAPFAVRRIYCVGLNYRAHAVEVGVNPDRQPPFFFQKPTDAIQVISFGETGAHPYPPETKDYHHEIELVVALGEGGRNLPPQAAAAAVYGYAVGLDMTRRDLQRLMMEYRLPWELGKSFDNAAVISPIRRRAETGPIMNGAISLKVNGAPRQASDLNTMIWNVDEIISILSRYFELFPGDIIYTGTPEGIGPVVPGDVMDCAIAGVGTLSARVIERL